MAARHRQAIQASQDDLQQGTDCAGKPVSPVFAGAGGIERTRAAILLEKHAHWRSTAVLPVICGGKIEMPGFSKGSIDSNCLYPKIQIFTS